MPRDMKRVRIREQKTEEEHQDQITAGSPVFQKLHSKNLRSRNGQSEKERKLPGQKETGEPVDHAAHKNHGKADEKNESEQSLQKKLHEEGAKIFQRIHVYEDFFESVKFQR